MGGFKGIGQFCSDKFCSNVNFGMPILPAEVIRAWKRIKNDSTAGADGINMVSPVKWNPSGIKFAKMFTVFWSTKY